MSNYTSAIPVDLKVPAIGMDLLYTFDDAGFEAPTIFGGFLRDTFRKSAFNDIDFRVGVAPAANRAKPDDIALSLLKRIPDITVLGVAAEKGPGYISKGHIHHAKVNTRFKAVFDNDGQDVSLDIILSATTPDVEAIALCADAPINGIAAGLDGRVYAHPLFEKDMNDKIYRILRKDSHDIEVSQYRAQSLQKRFEGLKVSYY